MLSISEKEMNQSCTQRHGQISEVILREKSKSQSNTYQKIQCYPIYVKFKNAKLNSLGIYTLLVKLYIKAKK